MSKSPAKISMHLGIIISLFSMLLACSSPQDYLERGKEHYEAGRYKKAQLEFKNVLERKKNNTEAIYYQALTHEKLGEWKSAYQNYTKLVKNDPKHTLARIRLSELYIASRLPDPALEMADAILGYDQANKKALLLRARAYALKDDLESAMQYAKSAFESDQERLPEYAIFLSTIHAKKDELEQGIAVLEESISKNPDNSQLYLRLADFYIQKNNQQSAKNLLEKLMQKQDVNASSRIYAAQLYLRMDMPDDSERILREAVEKFKDATIKIALIKFLAKNRSVDAAEKELLAYISESPSEYTLKFMLASLYEVSGQYDKAVIAYRNIIDLDTTGKHASPAKRKLALLLYKKGNKSEAHNIIDEAVKFNAIDDESRMVRGMFNAEEGNTETAINDFNSILRRQPNSLSALRLLASAYQLNKQPKLAEETLVKAVNAEPRNVKIHLQFAALMMATGKTMQAIKQLNDALVLIPNHPSLLDEKAKIQIKNRDWQAASNTIEQYKKIYPDSGNGYYLAGLLYQAQGKIDDSRSEFEKALQRNPLSTEAITVLIKSFITQGKYKEAIERIKRAQQDTAENQFNYQLLGEAQWSGKQYADAEKSFRKAIELSPKWNAPYIILGDMLTEQGRPGNAIEVLKQGLQVSPESTAVQLKLCMAYEHIGRFDLAIQEYEKLLARKPKMALAANNLAMLLVTHGKDKKSLDRALEVIKLLAEKKDAVFMDTIGLVHYKSGNIDEAVSILTDVVERAPDVQEFHYHLGMAYYKKGYVKLARRHLEMALKGKSNFAGIEEARSTLSKL